MKRVEERGGYDGGFMMQLLGAMDIMMNHYIKTFLMKIPIGRKSMGVTQRNLEEATLDYWLSSQKTLVNCLTKYICKISKELDGKSLLQAELAWAENHDQIRSKPCETLVLLVGLSLEPLMQSVCVYKPQKVILILNEEGYPQGQLEEWYDYARHVIELIKKMHEQGLIEKMPQFLGQNGLGYSTHGEPKEVFGTLLKVLHDENDVVIDVTGGKKSMVTGAFLYAAYSGIRISYVDFEKYDAEYRRPYGYTCKIGELANPYKEFALREWEQICNLYSRYQFDEATRFLNNITDAMQEAIPESAEPLIKLKSFFDYHAKWDRGDFFGAKQAATAFGNFEQPTAVVELGDKWYQIAGSEFRYKNTAKDFYGNPRAIQVYVCDEIERIRRLINYNEDYRSAFVRAGGVNEIIMLSRIVSLIRDPIDEQKFLEPLDDKTPNIKDIFKSFISDKQIIEIKKDIPFKNAPDIKILKPSRMKEWWQSTNLFNASNGWSKFLDIRNLLMHKYFSVPREWAKDALLFVKANFEDFLGHPISDLKIRTEALPWSNLCDRCGISPFLPPNLR